MPRLRLTPAERQRKLWERLDATVSEHGGWTVSQPYMFPVRFEAVAQSALPELLRAAGYHVVNAGSAERFLPATETVRINPQTTVKRDALQPMQIDIWQFELP